MAAAVNRDKVIAALAGGKTLSQAEVGKATGLEQKALSNVIFNMTKAGALLRTGERGSYDYALSDGTPPPKSARKQTKKAARSSTAGKRAGKAHRTARSAPPENEEAETDFAITGSAALSIKQDGAAIILGPQTFERLRDFINRTCPVWDPDGKA